MPKTSEERRIVLNRTRWVRKRVEGHHGLLQGRTSNCAPTLQHIAGKGSWLDPRRIGDDGPSDAVGDPRHRWRWRRHDAGARERFERHCAQGSARRVGGKLKRRIDEV